MKTCKPSYANNHKKVQVNTAELPGLPNGDREVVEVSREIVEKVYMHAKLSRTQVLAFRQRAAAGTTIREMARECGVNHTAVLRAVHGLTYKDVPGALGSLIAREGRPPRLPEGVVLEMRARRLAGVSLKVLASDYGTTCSNVSRICRGERRK